MIAAIQAFFGLESAEQMTARIRADIRRETMRNVLPIMVAARPRAPGQMVTVLDRSTVIAPSEDVE